MAIDPVKPKLSLGQIAEQTPVEMNEFSNAGKTLNFSAKNADRYLTYGSKAYGQLGYNPYRDNESKYQQETPWTKDISRGFNGMIKLAGVGMSDSFAFGAFGSEENHKDFGKIMSDYGSRRGGATEFWANTQLSAGYTMGIIASVAAEELLLGAATFLSGGAAGGVTAPLMAAEATRAGSLLSKLGRGVARFDSKIGKLAKLRNIEDARMFHSTVAGFGKALLPFGNTADFLRMFKPAETIGKDMAVAAANFKNLNGLTKTVMGAAALSRDARKIYLSHSESKLEANFVKDEIYDDAIKKWQIAHPGESISRKDNDFILAKSQAAYDKTYTTNFGLIYITNAITFEGLFKGFSPTNTLLRSIDNFGISGTGFRNVSIKSLAPSIKSYVTKKLSSITIPGVIKASVQASMEGVQEYGQDIIASAAKKYGVIEFEDLGFERDIKGKSVYRDKYNEEGKKIGKEKVPVFGNVKGSAKNMSLGAYWNDVSNSLGDSKFSTFASGALMGVFASPVNMATKVASEYSFGERGFGSEYNAWSAEGNKKYAELWKQREESAEIMTQLFQSQGASFEVDINATSHRMIGLREQMLEAGRTGDQKIFEDKKTEIFQLGMRELFKNGMEKELIDHLNQMSGYSAKELNESLDRLDITEDNKADFFEKIEKRKADISSLKKEYDRINLEMPSKGNVDSVLRDSTLTGDQKQERVLEIIAWDSLKEQMLFAGDKIRNFAERKKGIANNLKDNSKLTDTEISALTNREDLKEQIKLLEEQVASNKEYKMDDTKDHQKALIKLNALKDLQKGFISLDASTDESDINDIYSAMEDSFGRYMLAVNTELNSIPNESSLASDKNLYSRYTKKFKDLFDLYQITDEQKELEYYADILNNPKSSAKWLEARKAFLIEVGNNKKAYIKSSIESWQERETSDAILAELLDNGIIFELDELDDLLDKGVMPSKLYDVDTNNEVTSEKYDLAVKIIGKKYKSLTGKKIKGYKGSKDLGARAKAKGDKRKASGLLNAYAGKNKLNEPITVKDFINKLLAKGNIYLTKSEIELLEKFRLIPFTNNVILTDTADGPISFNEAGDLVLDIRFGASDYVMAKLPFEYVAISGLVQNIFSKKIEENQEFVSDITSMMNEAKQAYIARIVDEEKDTTSATQQISDITSSSLFNNPLVFIVESFTNKNFQLVLASIESDVDATNASIWKDLNRALRLELDGDFKGTMLDQVLGIAQLSLSESEIEEVVESPTVAEQETEEDLTETEEDAVATKQSEVDNLLVEANKKYEELKDKGLPNNEIWDNPEYRAIRDRQDAAQSELLDMKQSKVKNETETLRTEEDAVIEEPEEEEIVLPTSTIEERIAKKKEIQTRIKKLRKDVEGLETRKTKTSSLKFRSIFIIKKEIDNINIEVDGLLKEYERLEAIDKVVTTTDTAIVPESNTAINQVDDAGQTIINSFSKFDTLPEELQYLLAKKYYISIGKATPPMRELLDELTDDIIQSIEDNMHLPSFIDVIGQFNSNKPTSTVEIVGDKKETEDDDEDLNLVLFSDAAEKEFKATRERAYAGIMDAAIGGVTTTFVNHLGVEETINADSDISLRKIIADTYAIDGWANNTNNILGKTFKALVGDVVTEVEILIEKVKILPSGMIHVIALRTDNKEGKYYDMYVNPINGAIRSHRNNIGKISTLNDRFDLIIGFFGSIIEPFDPAVKSTRSSIKSTAPKFNIFTTAQEIKNEYVGIEDFFTDAELEIISTELSNITDAKAFASYLEDIGEALEQRRINKKKVTPVSTNTKADIERIKQEQEQIIELSRSINPGVTAANSYNDSINKGVWASKEEAIDAMNAEMEEVSDWIDSMVDAGIDVQEIINKVGTITQGKGKASGKLLASQRLNLYNFIKSKSKGEITDSLIDIINSSEDQINAKYNAKIAALGTTDTKIETTDFENKVENKKSNWGLLVAEQGYRYTGNDPRLRKQYKSDKDDYRLWTINQKDVDYIRYSSFDLFSLPKEEFLNAVLEKLQEAEDLSKSIKTIDVNLGQSEVEKIVMDQLKYALINNIAGTKVITALNRKLSQVKSDKVIKYTVLSKKGSSAVKVTTKSKSQMTKRVNKKTQLANEIGDYFTGNSDFLTEDQAKYLLYDALKTEKLHPEILGDIFSSGVTPSALKAYRSLLSNTSPFKTADGFADVFLDGMTIAFKNTWGSRANIFIELLEGNTSLSEMANYFEDVYFSETGADEDYEGRLSDEDLLQLYLTSDEKNKEDNAIQIDFQSSIEYQILTGQYKGNYNDLTNKQKELYDTINPKGKVSEKKDKEEDDFMDNLPKSTPFEIQVSLFSERYQGLSNSMQIKKMIDDIERATSINDIILIYSVVNNPLGKYSTDQKIIINNRIQTRVSVFQDVLLNEGVVTVELRSIDLGNGIILPAGTYMLQSNMTLSPNIGLRITEIKNNNPYTVNVLDLMGAVENIYEPGESINSQTLNLSLTNEDNETIKASIKNIFSNFNSNVSEFESIPDEELIAQINNEFNNCK